MSKNKNNRPSPRWLYWFVLILSVLIIILSSLLPFLMCVIFLLFGVFGVYYSIMNLFPKLRKPKTTTPPAPQDKPAPAPDAPPTLDAAPAADLPSKPVPDGYLSNGDPFYISDYNVAKVIHTKVVGVSYRNKDGSSRQEILSECFDGQQLQLESFTYKGDPAFRVTDGFGNQLGNLSADMAKLIDELPDDWIPNAVIDEITGGQNGRYYGCNIVITMYVKK